jgi:hypothetical protein
LGILAGSIGGLIGIGVAVFAVLYVTGITEYLGGKKKSSIYPAAPERLKKLLLALNGEDKPFEVKASPETDLLIEWKIADARWFALFGKEGLKETYRAYLLLDESRHSVRYCEELLKIRWQAGDQGAAKPAFSYQKQFFRGRILFQKSWEAQYGIKVDLSFGKVYEYKYDIREIRNPVRRLIVENGWEFVPVVSKRHAVFGRKS